MFFRRMGFHKSLARQVEAMMSEPIRVGFTRENTHQQIHMT